jgi:hypothetical protein
VNQTSPCFKRRCLPGPTVIPSGSLFACGKVNSLNPDPSVLIRPIPLEGSVNQRRPSGPVVIRYGFEETGNSVIDPFGVMRPIRSVAISMNHKLPSDPSVIPAGELLGVGSGNSVITPAVVMGATALPLFSVNHRLPSGPAVVIDGGLGDLNIVKLPDGVMREHQPLGLPTDWRSTRSGPPQGPSPG